MDQPTRILLVDDDEDDYLIIKKLLIGGKLQPLSLEWASDFETAFERIKKSEHDVYLIDYRLGEHTGMDLLRKFDVIRHAAPFIIMTGAGDEQVERDAVKIGAADYLVKGRFDAELLARVIRYSIQRKQLEQKNIQHYIDINRTKNEFISLASHELRTPATAVKQYIGMLIQGYAGELDDVQMKYLKSAYRSNERQLRTVNDILRIAALELNKVTLNKELCDINQVVAEAVEDIRPLCDQKQQQLTYERPKKTIMWNVDKTLLLTAISNLIENASKYSYDKQPIKVSLVNLKETLSISVHDEGVGIDTSDQSKLFQKFSRIHNPLSIESGGTGLGLYWTKEIIEMHGGKIAVESDNENGTVFTVNLSNPT